MSKRKSDEELRSSYRSMKIAGKRIDEHRLVMEQLLGRKLRSDEVVHHKDGNKLNNSPENLVVMTLAEHSRLHMSNKLKTEESKRKSGLSIKKRWEDGTFDSIKRGIIALDPVTGLVKATYASIREAAAQGYNRRHITSCCNGKRKQHKGLCWRFEQHASVAQ